jgi:hypothetical protein
VDSERKPNSEPKPKHDVPIGRHLHPATALLSAIVLVSFLGLNLWSSDGNHGFPFVWMTRSIPFALRFELLEQGDSGRGNFGDENFSGGSFTVGPNWTGGNFEPGAKTTPRDAPKPRTSWARVRAALPLEFFAGDFSRVESFSILTFMVALTIGGFLVYFPFRWFDWFFGRRVQPCYRFGLGRLLMGLTAVAVFFAFTNESRTLFLGKLIVVLAVPAAWLGISTWVVRRERAWARVRVLQRRERRAREAECAMEENMLGEIELIDVRPLER